MLCSTCGAELAQSSVLYSAEGEPVCGACQQRSTATERARGEADETARQRMLQVFLFIVLVAIAAFVAYVIYETSSFFDAMDKGYRG